MGTKILKAGHDIIDDVVVKNRDKNPELFDRAKDYPPYFLATNIGEEKFKLTPLLGRKIGKFKLIQDVINGVKDFKLNPGDGVISYVDDGNITSNVTVHPEIIKIIKVCCATAYTPNQDYAKVTADFVHELIRTAGNPTLPLHLPSANKTQKALSEEFNEYIKEVYTANGIKYNEEIVVTKKKKASSLVEIAEKVGSK